MGVVIPVGFGQLTIRWSFTGAVRNSVVTIGYDFTTIDPAAHAAIIDPILTAAAGPCNPSNMIPGWTYRGIVCTEMEDPGPISFELLASVAGSGTGLPMTPNVAVLVKKVTGAGGRRNRGRLFVPPIYPGESAVDSAGIIPPSDITVLNTRWNHVRTSMATAGLTWVLFHGSGSLTPTVITQAAADSRVATQRRRLRR